MKANIKTDSGKSRRAKQIFFHLSFSSSCTFILVELLFKANVVKVGGVLPHSSRSNQAGTEPPGFTTEALLQLNPLLHSSLVQTFAQQCSNKFLWTLGLGKLLYPATSWQAYQTQ